MTACAGVGTTEAGGFELEPITVGDAEIVVNVAATSEARQQGLMAIDELPEGMDGMLFSFEEPRSVSFTMRNTPLPLDIWWFDADGLLIGSTEMDPCFEAVCTSYRSPGRILWALETPRDVFEFEVGAVLSTG